MEIPHLLGEMLEKLAPTASKEEDVAPDAIIWLFGEVRMS